MTTIRQIERNWSSKKYERLFKELLAARPEAAFWQDGGCDTVIGAVAAAAMVMIRLDELGQSHVPLYGQLVRTLVAAQDVDGGWGDVATTALALRALLCGQGGGPAVERGITYLANLQKTEGIWPKVPLRRMPEDAATSAFVLYQLGDQPSFQLGVRLADALDWFASHARTLDEPARRLWLGASLRCRLHSLDSLASAAPLSLISSNTPPFITADFIPRVA